MMRSSVLAAGVAAALGLAACGADRGIKLSDSAKVRTACLKGARQANQGITPRQASLVCDCVTQKLAQSGYRYEKDVPKAKVNEIASACRQKLINSRVSAASGSG